MTPPDWDDERLDAAFHARFDRPAPPSLAHDVHVRIAGTSPARFAPVRLSRAWAIAVAAVIVVAVTGTALVGLGGLGRSGGQQAGSGDPTSVPGASAPPPGQALPGSVFGLPVVGLRDAIALRDSGTGDDSEFAVRGWFTPAPPVSCGPPPTGARTSPVQVRCPDDLVWLTEEAESLVHVTGATTTTDEPRGLAIHPDLDGLATDWFPTLPVAGVDGDSAPADVVLVGHFVDRRANMCPDAEIPACRARFVVDSVAFVDGIEQPTSRLHQKSDAISSDDDITAVVANEAPDSPILSMTVVDGPTGLAAVEPSLGTGQQGLIDQPGLWLVRVLESERVSTYVVIDGSDAIYEMNREGEAILVGGTPPTPGASSSAGPWPPADALVLELPGVDIFKPPVRVAIVDESGRFVSAMEQDPVTITLDGRFGAAAEPGKPGRVNLAWVGGICDSQITITVAADVRSILFDMGPQPDCDSTGVGHQLNLYFTGAVDVSAIQVGEAAAVPSPPASVPPTFTVVCGPLGPDSCESRTAEVVAAAPEKRVVSIFFSDECGSYAVSFDDGTGITASVDCIPGASPS